MPAGLRGLHTATPRGTTTATTIPPLYNPFIMNIMKPWSFVVVLMMAPYFNAEKRRGAKNLEKDTPFPQPTTEALI